VCVCVCVRACVCVCVCVCVRARVHASVVCAARVKCCATCSFVRLHVCILTTTLAGTLPLQKCMCCDIRYECPINVKVAALGSLSGQFDFLPLGPFITQIA
jgi:hypothetical protein